MSKEKYYVLHRGCDEPSFEEMSKEELLKRLGSHYYGDHQILERLDEVRSDGSRTIDLECMCGEMIIIKGEIVVPKPKEVVIEYELED